MDSRAGVPRFEPCFSLFQLCDHEQVTEPLLASFFPAVKWDAAPALRVAERLSKDIPGEALNTVPGA